MKCKEDETVNRIHPKSVCRSLLANLNSHTKLDTEEQSIVLNALKNTGIGTDRILANLSREAIKTVMDNI